MRRWLAGLGFLAICCCPTYGGGTCCAQMSFCSGYFVTGCICAPQRCGPMEAP